MSLISIVIPTYLRHDKLRDCLRSIREYVDPEMCSVEVVANGASEEARAVYNEWVKEWQGASQLLWFDEPLGYSRACNMGVRATSSDYVLLFNDDCEFLPQVKNECIDVLLKPFLEDKSVGITGPQRILDENSGELFLIFFCVMIRRKLFDAIGYLDESFGMGFGEDTAMCIQARCHGWKTLQVPRDDIENTLAEIDPNHPTLEAWKHDKIWAGDFKLWHDAESTIGRLPDSEEILRKNRKILRDRYGPRGVLRESTVKTPTGNCGCGNVMLDGICIPCTEKADGTKLWRAGLIDGWFGFDEGAQIARWTKELPKGAKVLEIGSWHGRSSRFIADNLPEGGQLWCVDTWIGSSGEPEMHGSAHYDRGDHAHQWWWCNLQTHINAGRVVPVRMHSDNAAHTLTHLIEKGEMEKFDLIFIDGDHSEEGIKTDDEAWSPLLKEGGLLCGHDYYRESEGPHWVHVRQYIETKYPNVQKAATSLWYVRPEPRKPAIFDCFPINDELDLLELRLNELDKVVDRWVIVEATKTHSGLDKPLYFQENTERFARWLNRITHIVVDEFPIAGLSGPDLHWAIERHQRNSIMRALVECRDDDVILIGDCDEIPKAEAVASYKPEMGLTCLEMSMHYGYMNLRRDEPWLWSRLLPYRILKELNENIEPKGAGPCVARYNWGFDHPNYNQIIHDGGWHFSFMGGPDEWVRKLEATPHQEYNKPEFKDKEVLQQRALRGEDILGRTDEPRYNWVQVDETYPKFVRENIRKFVDNKFLYEEKMHPESWQFIARVKEEYPDWFKGKKVLEVGSLDINGSVRQFFEDCDYEGIDIAEGKGVDRVCLAHQFFRDETYDVVISSEMLEHDQFWYSSLKQMYRNLKHGGLLIITCAGPARPEHGTERTNDAYSSPFTAASNHYRNISQDDLLRALPHTEFSECVIGYERGEEDLNFYGFKIPATAPLKLVSHGDPTDLIPPKDSGLLGTYEVNAEEKSLTVNIVGRARGGPDKMGTVTAEVSTKDRYFTTLPLALSAIATQTRKPEKIVIYDDGEQQDLREISPYSHILRMCEDLKIEWEVVRTPRLGQVFNHQHCLDNAKTDWIWRVDDDEVPLPNCLETLLNTVRDYGNGGEIEQIGAVAGLVHQPMDARPLPEFVDGSLKDVTAGLNIQWFQWNGGVREVEHLYSTFLYRVDAARKAGGYPKNLSVIGHREETVMSHQLKRANYKLLVTPHAKTYHLREATGGIRSFNDGSLWEKDEQVFQSYLQEWGANNGKPMKLIVLDNGLGDHFAFKSILSELRKRHADKEIVLAVCFPDVFEGEGLRLLSIADAKQMLGPRYDDSHLYRHLWDVNNKKPLPEAMLEFWG